MQTFEDQEEYECWGTMFELPNPIFRRMAWKERPARGVKQTQFKTSAIQSTPYFLVQSLSLHLGLIYPAFFKARTGGALTNLLGGFHTSVNERSCSHWKSTERKQTNSKKKKPSHYRQNPDLCRSRFGYCDRCTCATRQLRLRDHPRIDLDCVHLSGAKTR